MKDGCERIGKTDFGKPRVTIRDLSAVLELPSRTLHDSDRFLTLTEFLNSYEDRPIA